MARAIGLRKPLWPLINAGQYQSLVYPTIHPFRGLPKHVQCGRGSRAAPQIQARLAWKGTRLNSEAGCTGEVHGYSTQ